MPYCTQAQLEERYGTGFLIQLSDRGDAPVTQIDTAMITRAIADADALIDGYLKPVYQLPLSSVPAVITSLSLRIAIYNAHANVASEKITRDYDNALRTLREIASGVVKLDVDGVDPAASGASEVRTNEPERPLSAGTMKGFI